MAGDTHEHVVEHVEVDALDLLAGQAARKSARSALNQRRKFGVSHQASLRWLRAGVQQGHAEPSRLFAAQA